MLMLINLLKRINVLVTYGSCMHLGMQLKEYTRSREECFKNTDLDAVNDRL